MTETGEIVTDWQTDIDRRKRGRETERDPERKRRQKKEEDDKKTTKRKIIIIRRRHIDDRD